MEPQRCSCHYATLTNPCPSYGSNSGLRRVLNVTSTPCSSCHQFIVATTLYHGQSGGMSQDCAALEGASNCTTIHNLCAASRRTLSFSPRLHHTQFLSARKGRTRDVGGHTRVSSVSKGRDNPVNKKNSQFFQDFVNHFSTST